MPSQPLGQLNCADIPDAHDAWLCGLARQAYDLAQQRSYDLGLYSSGEAGGGSGSFHFLTIHEAQTLLPSIFLVLGTAFCTRLIIQLVKG